MKKIGSGIYASAVAVVMIMLQAVKAVAQGSVYDTQPEVHHNFFYYVPVPVLIFGSLIALAAYLVYHFWANGKLVDDMS